MVFQQKWCDRGASSVAWCALAVYRDEGEEEGDEEAGEVRPEH